MIYLLIFIVAFLLSLGFYASHFKNLSINKKHTLALFFLRFLILSLIGLIFYNPIWQSKATKNLKPLILVAVDVSNSMNSSKDIIQKNLSSLEKLTNRYELKKVYFSDKVSEKSNDSFLKDITNIADNLTSLYHKFKDDNLDEILLLSDGNQNQGSAISNLILPNISLTPVLYGDTTSSYDIEIRNVHSPSVEMINQTLNFPIELFYNANLNKQIQIQISKVSNGKKTLIKTDKVNISAGNYTISHNISLSENQIGLTHFIAEVSCDSSEFTCDNNTFHFYIEFISDKQKIAMLYDEIHPDLGVIKRCLSGYKGFEVISDKNALSALKNAHLIILFHEPNLPLELLAQFKEKPKIFILSNKASTSYYNRFGLALEVHGLNRGGLSVNQNFIAVPLSKLTQNLFTSYENHQFLNFKLKGSDRLLQKGDYDQIVFDKSKNPSVLISLQNLWQLRQFSFKINKNFQAFDDIWVQMAKYLVKPKIEMPFRLYPNKTIFRANESVVFKSQTIDKSGQLIWPSDIKLSLKNELGLEKSYLPLQNFDHYQWDISDLHPGLYTYKGSCIFDGQAYNATGEIVVTENYNEAQIKYADKYKMEELAKNHKSSLYLPHQIEEFIQIKSKQENKSIQKTVYKYKTLLDWPWLLVIIIILYAVEWIIRKRIGLL
ncbi:MAG: hypothetical protein MUE53_04545 [Chitinophagales bacterium]|nr:hypothetical protein [Chitinophagales bacterium]